MDNQAKPYMNSYIAGIGLGLVLLAAFVLAGRGLGASGALARYAAYAAHTVSQSVDGGVKSAAPTLAEKNAYMKTVVEKNREPLDDFLVFMLIGVLIGGFLSGAQSNRLSFEIIRGPNTSNRRRLMFAMAGGLISAFGARLARGCTSGQALTGGATMAVGSWAFMLAVFAGGYALAYFLRKEWL